ncbi:hypothetical protein KAW18_17890, partial [candidate division WOR-3 bacterium]|nr:hypothetical protein [candidate division WOR-3 bacterium]
GSYEYWYVEQDYDRYNQSGVKETEGTIDGDMHGGNIMLGYDNWTVQFSYREGDFDATQRWLSYSVDTKTSEEQEEYEITLRYLMRDLGSRHFVPYIIAGYNATDMKATQTITTSGWVWTRNNTTTIWDKYEYKAYLLGVGAIMPFNKYIGIRGDIRGGYGKTERQLDTGTRYTGDGGAFVGHLTGYWNVFKGLNLQVGGKYQYLDGGSTHIRDFAKGGLFAMFGYSYRF